MPDAAVEPKAGAPYPRLEFRVPRVETDVHETCGPAALAILT